MEHDADHKENEVGPWQVDIDQSTAKCKDSDSVFIVATVTGKDVLNLYISFSLECKNDLF
jgi:hypothetical protein